MFNKMYVDSISKVKPDKELINRTKEIMNKEIIEKKQIKDINFYKYATVAACLVVVLSAFAFFPKNIMKEAETNNSFVSDSSFEVKDNISSDYSSVDNVGVSSTVSFSSNLFAPAAQGSIEVESVKKSNNFFDWIKEIIQWFYELLF